LLSVLLFDIANELILQIQAVAVAFQEVFPWFLYEMCGNKQVLVEIW